MPSPHLPHRCYCRGHTRSTGRAATFLACMPSAGKISLPRALDFGRQLMMPPFSRCLLLLIGRQRGGPGSDAHSFGVVATRPAPCHSRAAPLGGRQRREDVMSADCRARGDDMTAPISFIIMRLLEIKALLAILMCQGCRVSRTLVHLKQPLNYQFFHYVAIKMMR